MSANELALLCLGYRDACVERDDLARRCRELEAQRDAAIRAAGNTASANRKLLLERDTLRAEVEQLRQQAARYERLRRLDPRQFAELHQRNLAGERFDDLVDAL